MSRLVPIWRSTFTFSATFPTLILLSGYGSTKEVRYLSRIYLWGQKLYQPLWFVLVEYETKQVILVSTNLMIPAEDIITSYAFRFKIETMFREFKGQFGGLFYHFRTKAVPRLDRYRRKNSPDPLSSVKNTAERARIIQALKATEGYVCCLPVLPWESPKCCALIMETGYPYPAFGILGQFPIRYYPKPA